MPIECYSQAAYDKFLNDEKSATLKAHGGTYGGGSETLIVEGIDGYNAATTGNKSSTLGCNCGMSTGRNGVCVFQGQSSHTADISASENIAPTLMHTKQVDVLSEAVVRRLTPLECERLQGFPDGWTDIGAWIDTNGKQHKDSDSPRYKALGNSIAIPPWFYVLQKITLCCGADNTMASLFDGIGGFPLIWEMLNGKGSCLWASEIEDFPIAVTKIRFPEETI